MVGNLPFIVVPDQVAVFAFHMLFPERSKTVSAEYFFQLISIDHRIIIGVLFITRVFNGKKLSNGSSKGKYKKWKQKQETEYIKKLLHTNPFLAGKPATRSKEPYFVCIPEWFRDAVLFDFRHSQGWVRPPHIKRRTERFCFLNETGPVVSIPAKAMFHECI